MFKRASDSSKPERTAREKRVEPLRYGIDFLDQATRGIMPDDLVLIGAPSGIGKTQLCCNIALANLANDKRVHYIALEAGEYEIERRLKYAMVAQYFYSDPERPHVSPKLNYTDWLLGAYTAQLGEYEDKAARLFEGTFENLHLYYKQDRFAIGDLIQAVHYCAGETDLIMIDHVHYFDFDDDNENRAIREIAKTVRTLAIEEQRPIILVAHLRKKDRANDELVAGLEEFHGSSDLYKIATRVVTLSPGKMTSDGLFETFFRIPKNRLDGGVTRFCAREFFNPKTGTYEGKKYQLGWADQKRSRGFEMLDGNLYPSWATGHVPHRQGGNPFPGAPRPPNLAPVARGQNDQ